MHVLSLSIKCTNLAALKLPIVLRPADIGVGHRTAHLAVHGVLDVGHELFRFGGDVDRCRFHCRFSGRGRDCKRTRISIQAKPSRTAASRSFRPGATCTFQLGVRASSARLAPCETRVAKIKRALIPQRTRPSQGAGNIRVRAMRIAPAHSPHPVPFGTTILWGTHAACPGARCARPVAPAWY